MVAKYVDDSHKIISDETNKKNDMEMVVLETRFAGVTDKDLLINHLYTITCMRDCFSKGEIPYASHVIYASSIVLDDTVADERAIGMYAGFLWGDKAAKTVVYADLGISSGMQMGIDRATSESREVEFRKIDFIPEVTDEQVKAFRAYLDMKVHFLKDLKEDHPIDITFSNVFKNKSKVNPKI